MTRSFKHLPHNLDAEASVLGGVILGGPTRRPEAVLALLSDLEVEHFYDHRHKVVFQAMRNLEAAQRPIDVVTLEVEIERSGKLEAIGDVAFLGELVLRVPTVDNVVTYAEIVRDKSRVRSVMLFAGELLENGYSNDLTADEYLDRAVGGISKIDSSKPDETVTLDQLLRRRTVELEELACARARGEEAIVGMPTGIAELDKRIGGYPLGDLTIIGARPAMGKTSMAMAAVDATTAAGFDAHVFSSEGGWRMYADRVLSRGSGIPVERVRSGNMANASDSSKLASALAKYRKRDNWALDPRADLSAREIVRAVRARLARKLAEREGKKTKTLVLVDYLNILARPPGDLNENDAFNEIITTFAKAAVNDDVAYVVLAQLNRDCEKRVDKRPQKSDLRGSGALEERARLILSPYRGCEYYAEPKKDIDFDCNCLAKCSCAPSVETWQETVQILLLKNNNGPTGRVFANWRAETTEMW